MSKLTYAPYQIPIDHSNPSAGTYKNRYFVDDDFYKPGSPVLVYDVGEASITPAVVAQLTSSSYWQQLLQEFNGLGIIWEHRWYGNSKPVDVSVSFKMPADQLKYLTVENALADIPYFAKRFNRSNIDYDLRPSHTPWVMIGGSYAGARTAYTRQHYPDVIYAGYASSAPVQFQADFTSYLESTWQGMLAVGLGGCAKDMHATMAYIDTQLPQKNTAANLKQQFMGPQLASNATITDFINLLFAVSSLFQQQFSSGSMLGRFCAFMEEIPRTNITAGPNGFAPTIGNTAIAQKWAETPQWASLMTLTKIPLGVPYETVQPDQMLWNWLKCSQVGFFQAANSGPHSLLPSSQSVQSLQQQCYTQFPEEFKKGYLQKTPAATNLVAKLGGWNIRPSNVFWTAGEFDPWSQFTPFSTADNAPHNVRISTDIPACNSKRTLSELFGYQLKGAGHGFDLSSAGTGDEPKIAQGIFINALREWLKCFVPR